MDTADQKDSVAEMNGDGADPGVDYKRKAAVISIVYLVGILVVAAWQVHSYGQPSNWIEAAHLNSLGDFLAGVFAPVAFIWVAVAVFIQSRELSAQRDELVRTRKEYEENRAVMTQQAITAKEQAAIAIATAKANYKFALFDKRVALYAEFEHIIGILNKNGRLGTDEEMRRLTGAIRTARFILGKDVHAWLDDVLKQLRAARKARGRFTRFESKVKGATLTDAEEAEALDLLDKAATAESDLMDMFDWNELDRLFMPYVSLPDDIAVAVG